MKYFVIILSAVVIEFASTFYILAVSDQQVLQMAFWAFVGPFLSLPFLKYQIEAKTNLQRIGLAFTYGLGYAGGAVLTQFINL
jgi:hypothetical protein